MDGFQFAITMFVLSTVCLTAAIVGFIYLWWKHPEIFSNRTRNFGGGSHD